MRQIIAGRVQVQRHPSARDRQSWLISLEMDERKSVTLGFARTDDKLRDRVIALDGQFCELTGAFGRHIFLVQEISSTE